MSHRTTTRHYSPKEVEDLEAAIEAKINKGQALYAKLYDTHRQRLAGRAPHPPAWHIWQQLDLLEDEINLLLSDLDRRRI